MTFKLLKPRFTPDEKVLVQRAANQVWNEIAYDLLQSTAESLGKDINRVTLTRANVIEVVCDASRLEEALRRNGRKDLADKVAQHDTSIYRVVRPGFPYERYGL